MSEILSGTTRFVGHRCSNYRKFKSGLCKDSPVVMGHWSPPVSGRGNKTNPVGKYFVRVNAQSPYGSPAGAV